MVGPSHRPKATKRTWLVEFSSKHLGVGWTFHCDFLWDLQRKKILFQCGWHQQTTRISATKIEIWRWTVRNWGADLGISPAKMGLNGDLQEISEQWLHPEFFFLSDYRRFSSQSMASFQGFRFSLESHSGERRSYIFVSAGFTKYFFDWKFTRI